MADLQGKGVTRKDLQGKGVTRKELEKQWVYLNTMIEIKSCTVCDDWLHTIRKSRKLNIKQPLKQIQFEINDYGLKSEINLRDYQDSDNINFCCLSESIDFKSF
jgi:hypothetical protein